MVMADTNIAASFDFNALLNAHKESGADVTIVYKKEKLPESARKSDVVKDLYYTLGLEGSKVKRHMNSQEGDPELLHEHLCDGTGAADQ